VAVDSHLDIDSVLSVLATETTAFETLTCTVSTFTLHRPVAPGLFFNVRLFKTSFLIQVKAS